MPGQNRQVKMSKINIPDSLAGQTGQKINKYFIFQNFQEGGQNQTGQQTMLG